MARVTMRMHAPMSKNHSQACCSTKCQARDPSAARRSTTQLTILSKAAAKVDEFFRQTDDLVAQEEITQEN